MAHLGVDLLFSQSAQVEDFLFVPRDGPSKNESISLSCATIDSLSGWTVWTKEESISSNGPAKERRGGKGKKAGPWRRRLKPERQAESLVRVAQEGFNLRDQLPAHFLLCYRWQGPWNQACWRP